MKDENINIRVANKDDFPELYKIGESTKEFRVSASQNFMDEDEFMAVMTKPTGVFLVAEENGRIVGFIYVSSDDKDSPLKKHWACLVYLVVLPEMRGKMVATKLYEESIIKLKELGVTNLYGWANAEGDGAILSFMKKHGFEEGHSYKWMDKAI